MKNIVVEIDDCKIVVTQFSRDYILGIIVFVDLFDLAKSTSARFAGIMAGMSPLLDDR